MKFKYNLAIFKQENNMSNKVSFIIPRFIPPSGPYIADCAMVNGTVYAQNLQVSYYCLLCLFGNVF